MKKIILLFLILFDFNICYSQSSWNWKNPVPNGYHYDYCSFINVTTGWAVGYNGAIMKTSNGGVNWVIQRAGYEMIFDYVKFFDINTGIIVGKDWTNCRILKTTNSGLNWFELKYFPNRSINSIQFINQNYGWCAGYKGYQYISRTTDGGYNWIDSDFSNINNFGQLSFANQNKGWICATISPSTWGTYILKTTNGGVNWFTSFEDTYNSHPNVTQFINENTGWVIGSHRSYRTIDGGQNWNILYTNGISQFQSAYFLNENSGYASDLGKIFKTTDSGFNWSISHDFFGGSMPNIYFHNDNTGWFVSYFNFYKTTNAGSNWNNCFPSITNKNLRCIKFSSQNTAWVCGEMGAIYKSTNGGDNWNQRIFSDTSIHLNCIEFINSSTGIIGKGDGEILRTTNGGDNWYSVSSSFSFPPLFSAKFINSQTGFIIGSNLNTTKLIRSTDAGVSWLDITGQLNIYNYRELSFISENIGYITVYYTTSSGRSIILKTTDYGNNWNIISQIYNVYLHSSFFINENTGWTTGKSPNSDLKTFIYKTTNSGLNWVVQFEDSTGYFYKIKFANLLWGLAVGYNGRILETTNGGLNWYSPLNRTQDFLSDITFMNCNTGWIVGNNGNIIKVVNGSILQAFTISGFVRYADNNQPVTSGWVKAIKLDKVTGGIIIVDSAAIQSDGSYTLTKVPQDSVDIGIYPNSTPPNDWVITYYPSTTYWEKATTLYPTGNLTNINIGAIRMNAATNNNSVNGKVMRLTNSPLGNLKDAVLYAKSGNTFVRCTMSDGNGVYHLNSLPAGSIKIVVNRLGFTSDSTTINVTATSNIDSINFYLNRVYVGVKKIGENLPSEYKLYQNYPNPFNPATIIRYSIPNDGFRTGAFGNDKTVLKVYDILGKEVVMLVNEEQKPGVYEVMFDASNLPSGIYFYRLAAGDFAETKRMILVK